MISYVPTTFPVRETGVTTGNDPEVRPFFHYLGGKWRFAKRYPVPRYDTIVEPFAGSAGYSLRYHSRNIILYDIDPVICSVWKYLIEESERSIMDIPSITHADQKIDDMPGLCQEAKWLVGLCVQASTRPGKSGRSRMFDRPGKRPSHFGWDDERKKRVARNLKYIRHWRVHNEPYECADRENRKDVTWFVDPPYTKRGYIYSFGNDKIDYTCLGDWCRNRMGQVIVCEGEDASWLPFRNFDGFTRKVGTRKNRMVERIWTKSCEG